LQRLHAIDVKDSIRILSYDLSDLFDRKQHARFVVGHHYGNNASIASQGLSQIIQIELAVFVYLEPSNLASDLREMFAEITHRFVLNAGSDDVARVGFCSRNPPIAQLSDSEPHEVKTISLGLDAPSNSATCSRARSTADFICRPSECAEDGLP